MVVPYFMKHGVVDSFITMSVWTAP